MVLNPHIVLLREAVRVLQGDNETLHSRYKQRASLGARTRRMSGCAQPPRQPSKGGSESRVGEDDLSCRAVGDTTSEGMVGCT